MGRFKNMILKWLGIIPAQDKHIAIIESHTFENNVLINQIWYRGDADELSQLYKQISNIGTHGSRFWTVVPAKGKTIRKLHTGLPAMIVDILTDVANDDCLGIELKGEENQKVWDEIAEDNAFEELQKEATASALVSGDACFRVSIDQSVSKYPLIEVFGADRVNYIYRRGRLHEIEFTTEFEENNKSYRLIEKYGKGYINYELYTESGRVADLKALDTTAGLEDIVFPGDFIMAVPIMFFKSKKYKNRGQSIIEPKIDSFDSLDEVVSQWIDAIRLGRAMKLIPEELIPKSPTGESLDFNPMINQYEIMSSQMRDESKEIKPHLLQPEIAHDAMLASYIQFLDMSLQGLVSPSTLGIDVKKLDNAEAQREKEKVTLYTRSKIVTRLSAVIPRLVEVVLKANDILNSKAPGEYEATISFGEYANPSFEAAVETVGKAVTYRIMSLERAVEELYGESMTDKEKEIELQRIKEQYFSTPEPGAFPGMDNMDFYLNEHKKEAGSGEEEKKKTDESDEEQ